MRNFEGDGKRRERRRNKFKSFVYLIIFLFVEMKKATRKINTTEEKADDELRKISYSCCIIGENMKRQS